jgi:hypothetical protein
VARSATCCFLTTCSFLRTDTPAEGSPPEIIGDLSQIHPVGVLAQVYRRMHTHASLAICTPLQWAHASAGRPLTWRAGAKRPAAGHGGSGGAGVAQAHQDRRLHLHGSPGQGQGKPSGQRILVCTIVSAHAL